MEMHIRNSSAAFGLALILAAALSGCGPQKHENQARENQARENQEHFGRGGRHGIRAICADDIQKFCATADRPRRCLRQNIDKISPACKDALAQLRNRNRDNDSQAPQPQQQQQQP